MLQLEDPLHNLIRGPLRLNLHRGLIIRDNRLLLSEVTHAAKNQVAAAARDLHLLAQHIHVATDLLEIRAVHVDNAGEVEARDTDVLDVRVEEFEVEVCDLGLLRILHADPQLVRIIRRQVEGQAVIVAHSLDQFEKIDHVHAEHMFHGAIEVLELVRMQTQIHEDCVRLVYRHNLNTL